MKKFTFTAALVALALSVPVFAQNLRQNVCIVREQFSPETKVWLKETSEYLSQKGYSKYEKEVKELDDSTFGSGFVYVAPNGKNYIITNRHVVSSAEYAKVLFENTDGTYTTYENLKVVATDKDLDLALLEFADGKNPFKSGLPIAKTPVTDGEEIWTAGFPGLVGSPSWQLGKGNVTNASTRLKELVDPNISLLIQHSAPVDAGNSGGPLLRNRGGTYEVVGVNTWKVNWRQSTNLSMPASTLQNFIQQGTNPKVVPLNNRVRILRTELIAEEISLSNIEKFIAKSYAREYGADYFVNILRTANSTERAAVLLSFENSPISGFTAAVAINTISKLLKNDFIKESEIGEIQRQDNDTYTVEFINKNKKVVSIWKLEAASDGGQWCLCGFADEEETKKLNRKPSNSDSSGAFNLEQPYALAVSAGWMNAAVPDSCFGVKGTFLSGDFFGTQMEVDFAKFKDGNTHIVFSPGIRLNVPLNFGNFFVMPYGEAGFTISIGSFGFGYHAGGGLEAGYKLERLTIYGFGEYSSKKLSAKDPLSNDEQNYSKKGLSFGIGVGFAY